MGPNDGPQPEPTEEEEAASRDHGEPPETEPSDVPGHDHTENEQ